MADLMRVCNCFLDVAIYCLVEDLAYAKFFHHCLQVKYDRKNTILNMKTQNNCFIACCFDIIKNQDFSNIDWTRL